MATNGIDFQQIMQALGTATNAATTAASGPFGPFGPVNPLAPMQAGDNIMPMIAALGMMQQGQQVQQPQTQPVQTQPAQQPQQPAQTQPQPQTQPQLQTQPAAPVNQPFIATAQGATGNQPTGTMGTPDGGFFSDPNNIASLAGLAGIFSSILDPGNPQAQIANELVGRHMFNQALGQAVQNQQDFIRQAFAPFAAQNNLSSDQVAQPQPSGQPTQQASQRPFANVNPNTAQATSPATSEPNTQSGAIPAGQAIFLPTDQQNQVQSHARQAGQQELQRQVVTRSFETPEQKRAAEFQIAKQLADHRAKLQRRAQRAIAKLRSKGEQGLNLTEAKLVKDLTDAIVAQGLYQTAFDQLKATTQADSTADVIDRVHAFRNAEGEVSTDFVTQFSPEIGERARIFASAGVKEGYDPEQLASLIRQAFDPNGPVYQMIAQRNPQLAQDRGAVADLILQSLQEQYLEDNDGE